MQTFDRKTYLNAKAIGPEMALAMAVHEMEIRNKESLAEIEKRITEKLLAEMQYMPVGEMMKNIALIKGNKGDTPKSGEDFPTHEQIHSFIKENMPKKGLHYFTEQEIENIIHTIESRIIIPKAKDGKTPIAGMDYPTEEQMREHIIKCVNEMPKYNEKELLTKLQKLFPKIEIDPKAVVQGINGLPIKPEFQFKINRIEGLETNLRSLKRPRQLGGPGGGGLPTKSEILAPTQSGSDITLNLAQLSRSFSEITGVFKNGLKLNPNVSSGWTRSGNTVTVANSTAESPNADEFIVDYSY